MTRAIAVVLFCATALRAAEPSREATAAQNEGVRAFDQGRYGEAIEQFQRAYGISAQPPLLLAIAKAAFRLGERDRAKACLFDFLRDDPKSLSASEAFELLTRIEKESAGAKAKEVKCLRPVVKAEVPRPAPTPSPQPEARPWPPPATRPPAPQAAVAAQPQPQPQVRSHGPWSYAAVGGAVAAAGVGTYFGLRNLSATNDWRNATTPQAISDAHGRASSAATAANVAWIAASALAVTGVSLYLFTNF